MNFDVQKARSGMFWPETTTYDHSVCYERWFKYLCARDGCVHNSFDMNVTYGTLSESRGSADIIYCTMQRMTGKGG
jgi:hypothetical protein